MRPDHVFNARMEQLVL